jgi:hypothetical protein
VSHLRYQYLDDHCWQVVRVVVEDHSRLGERSTRDVVEPCYQSFLPVTAKEGQEMIVVIVVESHFVGVAERNHSAGEIPVQMASDVNLVLGAARCLATSILVFEMVKVLNESKLCRRKPLLMDGSKVFW